MAPLQFCDLPDELIVRVLNELNIRDLLSCATTCHILHRTIQDAVTLQYRIELLSSGMEDTGSTSRLSIAERLEELKNRQESWMSLRFRQRCTFSIPEDHVAWEFVGNVLGYGLNPSSNSEDRRDSGFRFTALPSIVLGTSLKTWEHRDLAFEIEDFTHDPSQNLVAFIPRVPVLPPPAPSQERRIHLIALDSGEHHPMATYEVLRCTPNVFTEREPNFLVEVMHDHIALLLRSPPHRVEKKQELFIWNWKSGRLVINFMYPLSERATRIDSFAFLSPRHFVLSRLQHSLLVPNPPMLEIYDFGAPESQESQQPMLVRSFELPPVAFGTFLTSTLIRAYTYTDQASQSSKPFWTSNSPRLLTVSIDIFRGALNVHGFEHASYVLFVHQSTLLASRELEDEHDPDVSVPWNNWGPKDSRLLTMCHNERQWICFAHGTRYVRVESEGEPGEPFRARVKLLDFNPLLVKRGLVSDFGTSSKHVPWVYDVVPATRPTIVSAPDYWARDIITALPYCEIQSGELFDYEAVMISEECLLGTKHETTSGGSQTPEKGLEVLCL